MYNTKITYTVLMFAVFVLTALLPAPGSADEIAPNVEAVEPLKVGEKLPNANLKDSKGEPIALHSLTEGKSTALIFYRGGWCPYCNMHLRGLNKVEADLKEMGIQIIALAPDTPEKVGESTTKLKVAYSIYADYALDAAKKLGIAFKMDPNRAAKYEDGGIALVEKALPVPSVFLIDEEGVIQFVHADGNYKVRLKNDALLDAAKAMTK